MPNWTGSVNTTSRWKNGTCSLHVTNTAVRTLNKSQLEPPVTASAMLTLLFSIRYSHCLCSFSESSFVMSCPPSQLRLQRHHRGNGNNWCLVPQCRKCENTVDYQQEIQSSLTSSWATPNVRWSGRIESNGEALKSNTPHRSPMNSAEWVSSDWRIHAKPLLFQEQRRPIGAWLKLLCTPKTAFPASCRACSWRLCKTW